MTIIICIVMIIAGIYLGVSYGRMWLRNQELEELANITPNEATPIRYMFVGAACKGLVAACLNAHEIAQIKIKKRKTINGIEQLIYSNNDEIWYWDGEQQLSPLSKSDILGYANKMFFDTNLTKDVIWKTIDELGLKNFTVTVGIYGEENQNDCYQSK